ncbi:WD repeat-containing protein 91-like [Bolinopsis microptera]|uniref:WD repeat-containing protein 91-like n=1 Tax=Bolinopsis microptera TaxID=2820187 RepID=UPI003078C74A
MEPPHSQDSARIWCDTVHTSLQNFISTVLDAVPLPALLQWKDNTFDEVEEKQQLQREVTVLKMKLQDTSSVHQLEENNNLNKNLVTRSDLDIAEDFYIISASRSPEAAARSPHTDQPSTSIPRHKNGSFTSLNHRDYTEHTAPLIFARFSCEGMFCATSDINGTLKVWTFSPDIKTLHSFVFKSGIYSLHWATKIDKLLYVGTGDSKIKILNISNRKITQELSHPTDNLRVISLASNVACTHLVSSGTDKEQKTSEFIVWDCKTRECLQVLEITPLPSPITSTHYNHNGNLLVCGAMDGMIRVYADYQCIMGWQASSAAITTVKFSVDENTVFAYCKDGSLSQWRLYPMSQCLYNIPVSDTPPQNVQHFGRDIALDSEGKYLLVGRGFQAVVYSIENGLVEDSVLPSQGSKVSCVDWHVPYSTRLCLTATTSGIARIIGLL